MKGLGGLAGTLHDAETRQVEDFIRQRSKVLDSDISAMRKRLGLGIGGGAKSEKLGEGIPNVLSSVEGMGASTSMTTSLRVLRDEAPVFSGHDTSAPHIRPGPAGGVSSPPRAASMKDRLGTFLARIKIRKLGRRASSTCLTPRRQTLFSTHLSHPHS